MMSSWVRCRDARFEYDESWFSLAEILSDHNFSPKPPSPLLLPPSVTFQIFRASAANRLSKLGKRSRIWPSKDADLGDLFARGCCLSAVGEAFPISKRRNQSLVLELRSDVWKLCRRKKVEHFQTQICVDLFSDGKSLTKFAKIWDHNEHLLCFLRHGRRWIAKPHQNYGNNNV